MDQIHEAAHAVGFKTTATMMYGHVETDEDIVETLQHIRDVQDAADANGDNDGGFTAFIPCLTSEKTRRWVSKC